MSCSDFQWSLNIIRNCFGFTLLLSDNPWLVKKNSRHQLRQPIRCKPKTNRDLVARVFPRLAPVTCIFFEFSLVYIVLLRLLWLAMIALVLVLVLRHLMENRQPISSRKFHVTWNTIPDFSRGKRRMSRGYTSFIKLRAFVSVYCCFPGIQRNPVYRFRISPSRQSSYWQNPICRLSSTNNQQSLFLLQDHENEKIENGIEP